MAVKIAQWRGAIALLLMSQLVIVVVFWCHHELSLPGRMVNAGPGTTALYGRNVTAYFHVSLEQQVVHWESIRFRGNGICRTISADEDDCRDCNSIKVGPELFTIRDAWNSFTSLDCLARDVHHGKTGISARFHCPRGIGVAWRACLEHDWHFVRVFVSLFSTDGGSGKSHLKRLSLLSVTLREECGATEMSGTVKGSPILLADSRYFMSAEHPLSEIQHLPAEQHSPAAAPSRSGSKSKRLAANVEHLKSRLWPPSAGKPWHYSAAIGVISEASQARREFLAYLDMIRPAMRWQQPLVHYNSWYDMHSWADESLFDGAELKEMLRKDQMSEGSCLRRIKDFKVHLGKRNVTLDSFLFDDGWDDPKVLGAFNKEKFPRGFTTIVQAARKEGADGIGIWLSPWGGYGAAQDQRLEYGKKQGYEMNANGFSLAGPKYYAHFREVVLKMRKDYGVNLFKFDGLMEDPDDLAEELEAMMTLISELRSRISPLSAALGITSLLHLFDHGRSNFRSPAIQNKSSQAAKNDPWINLTTGTWPSPFFLLWVDSIWRGGNDLGAKRDDELKNLTRRQRWIVWREWQVCKNVAQKAQFFPLSQLMIHGVVVGGHGEALVNGLHMHTPLDFAQEVWSFVAMGFQLQELYLSPQFLARQDFDVLGEALRWARSRAAVLRDAHWVLGHFKDLTPYGAAAWKASDHSDLITAHVASDHSDLITAHVSGSLAPSTTETLGILLLRNPLPRGQPAPEFTLAEVLELPARSNTSTFSVSLVRSLSSDEPRSEPCVVGKAALPGACIISAGEPVVLDLLAFEVLVLEFRPFAIR